jgi:hypothetical protein
MQKDATKSLEVPDTQFKTPKRRITAHLEIELDLRDSDKDTFQKLQKALKESKNIDLHVFNGTHWTTPCHVLNWFWLLNLRNPKCKITSTFHSSLKTGALVLAVLSDSIVPRLGSFFMVPSVENVIKEINGNDYEPLSDDLEASLSNLRQVYYLLGQFINLKQCTDNRIPISRLLDYGLPVKLPCRSKFIRQVELSDAYLDSRKLPS